MMSAFATELNNAETNNTAQYHGIRKDTFTLCMSKDAKVGMKPVYERLS
jgi:hypothetical protein